jgi:peptidyl-prolyl cis-trans isomerase B (cyclophilin B)
VPTKQERDARASRDRLKRYTARQEVHAYAKRRRLRDNLVGVAALVVVLGLATTAQVLFFTAGPGAPEPLPEETAQPDEGANVGDVPEADLAEGRTWTGSLTLNDVPLGIELDGAAAPQGVSVLIDGIDSGYYVGRTCHRLVESESAGLIQCGSLNGDGQADPDFSFGPIENAAEDGVYPAGTIALARGGTADSNGRQFFITFAETTLRDDEAGGYTVLGTVTSGLDELVSQIADGGIEPGADGTESQDGAPVVPTEITAAEIE